MPHSSGQGLITNSRVHFMDK